MLLKIYLAESHGREGGTLANSNISGDFLAYPIACQIIDSVITVLGPDIQESMRKSGLVQNLGGCDVETSTTIQDRVIGTIHGLRSTVKPRGWEFTTLSGVTKVVFSGCIGRKWVVISV